MPTGFVAAGILTAAELAEVEARLATLDIADLEPDDEDIHSAIERLLGDLGRKIHAGRSRNDQVATALRLYVRDACAEAEAAARRARAGRPRACRDGGGNPDARLHPSSAGDPDHPRPSSARLGRDARARPQRLRFAAAQATPSPLGAGALAGSTLPLPPPPEPMRNSLDAVADRDFALDYLYAGAVGLRPPLPDQRGACPLDDE